MGHFRRFMSVALLLLLCSIGISTVQSSSTGGNGYSGVIASNTVSSTMGTTVWNVNFVGAFAVGDRVQITWTMDSSDFMTGDITAVDASAPTITVLVDTISGPTGILWSPWAFTLISIPSSTSALSISGGSSISGSGINGFNGVVASNNMSSVMGLTVWNVTFTGAFAVGDRVQVTWTMDSSDFMQGVITAVDPNLSTITVNVDTISGPTGIVWTPWVFSLISLPGSAASSGSPPTNSNPYGNGALHQYHEQPLMLALMMLLCIISAMITL